MQFWGWPGLEELGDQRSLKLEADMTPTYSGSNSCFLTREG